MFKYILRDTWDIIGLNNTDLVYKIFKVPCMKHNLLLIFFFIFSCSICQAQTMDSLWAVYNNTSQNDTSRIKALLSIAKTIRDSKPDSSILLAEQAIKLAAALPNGKGEPFIAKAHISIGTAYDRSRNHPKAMEHALTALRYYEKVNDKRYRGICYNLVGIIYLALSDYTHAVNYINRSLEIRKEIKDTLGLTSCYGNLGIIYYNQADYPKALENFFKQLELCEKIEEQYSLSNCYNAIGSVYSSQKNYNKALEYFFKSLKIARDNNDQSGIGYGFENIGIMYHNSGDHKKALQYYDSSIAICELTGDIGVKSINYKNKSELYAKTGQYKEAYEYHMKYAQIHDSIFNSENSTLLGDMKTNFEIEKKETELKLKSEAQEALSAKEKQKQQLIIISISIGLFLVLIFTGFIYRSNRQKQKTNLIISEQNKEITDSINYALRIQKAKLPKMTDVLKAFPESFILFKPKAIVSGDFYFFQQKQNVSVIAAADCTGHGVPGAFMSIIGCERLEDAVTQSNTTSETLKRLNKGMKASLRQSANEESTRDGMDIALCHLNPTTRELRYAAANRPLWIIEKNKNEIHETKATKKAIGGLTEDEQEFTEHVFTLNPGDTFYIFSDGYADQFGGQDQKKMTTKRFKDFLLSIQSQSMEEQEISLNDYFDKWKDGSEQIDDVLIIGIRV
ncbi:MAG: protein serine/threonine phosphatase [Bacteroidetes bacterium]|nr:protein serine/threonine phosphatase [Bacteroidota bacterium]